MKIKVCKKYYNINKLQKRLNEAFPNDTIVIESCIKLCKKCKETPVAKADGNKVKAKSISKLISKIDAL